MLFFKKKKETDAITEEDAQNAPVQPSVTQVFQESMEMRKGLLNLNDPYFSDASKHNERKLIDAHPFNIIRLSQQNQMKYWKEVIATYPFLYLIAPEEFKSDEGIVKDIISKEPFLFTAIDQEFKDNQEIQSLAVEAGKDNIFSQFRRDLHGEGLSLSQKEILHHFLFKQNQKGELSYPSARVPISTTSKEMSAAPQNEKHFDRVPLGVERLPRQQASHQSGYSQTDLNEAQRERKRLMEERLRMRRESLMNNLEKEGFPRLDKIIEGRERRNEDY